MRIRSTSGNEDSSRRFEEWCDAIVTWLLYCYRCIAIAVSPPPYRTPYRYRRIAIAVSLSPCRYRHVAIAVSLYKKLLSCNISKYYESSCKINQRLVSSIFTINWINFFHPMIYTHCSLHYQSQFYFVTYDFSEERIVWVKSAVKHAYLYQVLSPVWI